MRYQAALRPEEARILQAGITAVNEVRHEFDDCESRQDFRLATAGSVMLAFRLGRSALALTVAG
jgi:hypothetical protein